MTFTIEGGHPSSVLQPNRERPKQEVRHYDAVVVLTSKVRRSTHRRNNPAFEHPYVTNDYRNSDRYGILGAGMRLVAAEEMLRRMQVEGGEPIPVVFTGGVSQKTKDEFGANVPVESHVYRDKFLRVWNRKKELAKEGDLPFPDIIAELEEKAANSTGNVEGVLAMMKERGWKRVAIITNDYHKKRVELLVKDGGGEEDVDVFGAEKYVKSLFPAEGEKPGKYSNVIRRSRRSPEWKKRKDNEKEGQDRLREGNYRKDENKLAPVHGK